VLAGAGEAGPVLAGMVLAGMVLAGAVTAVAGLTWTPGVAAETAETGRRG
jgi:hypothetical protein